MDLFNWAYNIFREMEFSEQASLYGNLMVNIAVLCIAAVIIDFISKKIFIFAFGIFATRTKTTFDDILIENKTSKYVARLVPVYFIYHTAPLILTDFTYLQSVFNICMTIFIIFLMLWLVRSVFNSVRDYLKLQPNFADKPIDSYIQVIMIVLWFFGIASIIMILFKIDSAKLIGTLGAVSAVILLIFKDTILGFVASIQVSVNDMVRIGDWITIEKFGADGDVIEINLATVKVRNFDNTTTTLPTYSLISDSFRNWRGMVNSGGRRIKRHILIKNQSVHFVSEEDLEEYSKIQLINSYIDHRKKDIEKYNTQHNADKSLPINGRNMTNLGLFRSYISNYLQQHPAINKDLTLMCRHLQPTEKGIPIEIYAFSSDKRWANYEYIMADIFDHIIASVPYFKLEIFELPSNKKDFVEAPES